VAIPWCHLGSQRVAALDEGGIHSAEALAVDAASQHRSASTRRHPRPVGGMRLITRLGGATAAMEGSLGAVEVEEGQCLRHARADTFALKTASEGDCVCAASCAVK